MWPWFKPMTAKRRRAGRCGAGAASCRRAARAGSAQDHAPAAAVTTDDFRKLRRSLRFLFMPPSARNHARGRSHVTNIARRVALALRPAGTEVPAPHQSVWSRNFSSGGHPELPAGHEAVIVVEQVSVGVEPELQFRRTSYASAPNP